VSAEVERTAPRGDGPVRRVRLPADRRTPAAARALVRSVLAEAHLDELLNEALLLTTELSTNAILHAGTELDIEIFAGDSGVTVVVTDFAPGPANHMVIGTHNDETDVAMVSERGRGLLLVDHFASRWGTTHDRAGKGVWFHLDRQIDPMDDAARTADGRSASPPSAAAMTAVMQVTPDPYAEDPLPGLAADLLARVADIVGATGGVVRLDRGDGAGSTVLARYGRPPRPGEEQVRIPLAVSRPYAGELELDTAPSAYARPLAALAAERLSLHLENDRLRRADRRRQTWLTFLAESSELLAQSLDVDLTLALIPQLVVPRLGQWCAVHTSDEWGHLQLASASHADEAMLPQLHELLQESGPDAVLPRLREAVRIGWRVALGPPLEGFAVPLTARGQRLGTLAVGRHHDHRQDPDEIGVLEDVARRAGLAIENARIHAERRRVARALQQSLLPPVLPIVRGIGFAAEYVPAGDTADVGGDFYDVIPLPDDRWLVVVGDVSGKGVSAAAVTGLVRDVLRVLISDGKPLPEALARLNETLIDRGAGRYCTLAMATVGRSAGDHLDVCLNLAGHDCPVLLQGDGATSFVGEGGTALGLLDSVTSPAMNLTLAPGDALIFYTDGVTERRRGRELFGTARLRDAATPLAGYSADVVAARLRSTAIGFSAEAPRDDIAVLVLRNDGGPAGRPVSRRGRKQRHSPDRPRR
jgi:phosphoserine phosphatase RsbU/P